MFERISPQEYKNSTSFSIFPGAHAVKQEQGTCHVMTCHVKSAVLTCLGEKDSGQTNVSSKIV